MLTMYMHAICIMSVLSCLVCSCTIWLGHLSKTVKETQIKEAFEDFGQVKSVDVSSTYTTLHILGTDSPLVQVVAARGCAYIVMVHRSDAVRALSGLKDVRLGGSACKVSYFNLLEIM